MVGLATKARKIAVGEERCEDAIKKGMAYLVIIAGDTSGNTKKNIINACNYYEVSYIEYAKKDNLGSFCGYSSVSAAAVIDENFAKGILKKYNDLRKQCFRR